jgi:L-seryl-tRNA(Ser) seleniumtransferase
MSGPLLRSLPSVEKLLGHALLAEALRELPHSVVADAVRDTLAEARAAIKGAKEGDVLDVDTLARAAAHRARLAGTPALRRVLNATGVVLHTNLGRAPLSEQARRIVADVAAGYSSLEYDLEKGERGELVEIGGSFRVPEIMELSGATLVEVGATNRTHTRDYEKALDKHHRDVAAILRVHRSNFRMEGFVHQPELAELAALAKLRGVPLIEDLGSGALADLSAFGLEREPTISESLEAGVSVVTCSGDKLLGASQAGLILGQAKLVTRIRKHPLARALRMDKLALAALEATLPFYADPERACTEIPVLVMLAANEGQLTERAQRLASELRARVPGLMTDVASSEGEVGGGSLPSQRLTGPVVLIEHPMQSAVELEARARAADPPVIGTIRADRFRLDPRTLTEVELAMAATALARVWTGA